MDLAELLRRADLTLEGLAARLRDALALEPGDMLYACGSLVEGLGNAKSDLDFYLVTARKNVPLSSLNSVFVLLGDTVCDVCVLDRAVFEQTIGALERWAASPRDPRSSMAIRENDRRLLHRARVGIALFGGEELERARERIPHAELARHKLDWARYHTDLAQVDLAGMRDAGDWPSMILMAQELLGHTVDALLAAHGELNPSPKWRAKLLERLPGIAGRRSALDRFFALHGFTGPRSPRAIFEHSVRIASFSRQVLAAAERMILAPELPAPPPFELRESAGPALPALELDVVVSLRDGGFELHRLTVPKRRWPLVPEACAVIALFDGETPRSEGERCATALWGDEGPARLEELLALVRHEGLEAEPPIDEDALTALLR